MLPSALDVCRIGLTSGSNTSATLSDCVVQDLIPLLTFLPGAHALGLLSEFVAELLIHPSQNLHEVGGGFVQSGNTACGRPKLVRLHDNLLELLQLKLTTAEDSLCHLLALALLDYLDNKIQTKNAFHSQHLTVVANRGNKLAEVGDKSIIRCNLQLLIFIVADSEHVASELHHGQSELDWKIVAAVLH